MRFIYNFVHNGNDSNVTDGDCKITKAVLLKDDQEQGYDFRHRGLIKEGIWVIENDDKVLPF